MQRRYNQFNPKRKLRRQEDIDFQQCAGLASRARYGGNPEHKRNPGDFGLTPPSGPRPGKSLCDSADIYSRAIALKYLKLGLRKGLISERHHGQWPQNIWSVTDDGKPLEAQLENSETGTYHGYPMPESDPMAAEVIRRWKHHNDTI